MPETQVDIWNDVGDAWVRHRGHFDATLKPFGTAVMDRLDLVAGERVLDIGGGAGSTTIELAARVTPGEVVNVDPSGPMVREAQRRIAEVGLTNARAIVGEVHEVARIEAGTAFDAAYSRFGVMFFEDPPASFRAIGSALRPGGRLGFVCFADIAFNPFIAVPVGAAIGLLDVVLPGPNEPSPFSLADPDHLVRLLEGSGFTEVGVEPGPDEADLGRADDLDAMAVRLLEQNPSIAAALRMASVAQREGAAAAAAHALAGHQRGDRIVAGAKTWIVTARRPG